MQIRGNCAACHKRRWFVRKRSYYVDKISPAPITSEGELCNKCARAIKKLTNII